MYWRPDPLSTPPITTLQIIIQVKSNTTLHYCGVGVKVVKVKNMQSMSKDHQKWKISRVQANTFTDQLFLQLWLKFRVWLMILSNLESNTPVLGQSREDTCHIHQVNSATLLINKDRDRSVDLSLADLRGSAGITINTLVQLEEATDGRRLLPLLDCWSIT